MTMIKKIFEFLKNSQCYTETKQITGTKDVENALFNENQTLPIASSESRLNQ